MLESWSFFRHPIIERKQSSVCKALMVHYRDVNCWVNYIDTLGPLGIPVFPINSIEFVHNRFHLNRPSIKITPKKLCDLTRCNRVRFLILNRIEGDWIRSHQLYSNGWWECMKRLIFRRFYEIMLRYDVNWLLEVVYMEICGKPSNEQKCLLNPKSFWLFLWKSDMYHYTR